MPTYRITSPDGKTFDVTAPEGASQDQVLEYAKSNWAKSASAKPVEQTQVEDPGFLQSLLIGTGRTVDRVGKGMQQLVANPIDRAALAETAAEDDRLYKPLQKLRPWATGIGEALPAAIVPGTGATTMLGNMGRMAFAGALPGALQYGSAEERLKRAGLGAAGGAAVPVIGAAAKSGASILEPLFAKGREAIAGRTLNRVAGDNAPDVVRRMQGATELVPGSRPTAAQVAESGGIAALERSASASNPEAYTQRAMEQAGARMDVLRGIGKDGPALQAAEAARDAAAGPLYTQAKAATMQATPELQTALKSLPNSVQAKAKALAKLAGEPIGAGDQYTGRALHYIKLALDDQIGRTGESALGATEKRLMMEAKDRFLSAVDAGIPAYGQARQKFAELSRPVNQMQIGQELSNRLAPALNDFGALGGETAATFGRAMRDADGLAASATGFKGAKLDAVMDPGQMGLLAAVGQDLGRKSNAQNLGRGVGSDTFQKLSMQNVAEQSGMPRLVGGLLDLPVMSRATAWAYRETDEKMQALLADALLNPRKAAELMAKADKKWLANNPGTRRLLEQSAVRSGGLLGMAAADSIAQPAQ